MRRIPVETLAPVASLSRPLFHESGALLFAAGDRIGDDEISLLRRSGIKRIYEVGADDAAEDEADPGAVTTALAIEEPREPAVTPADVSLFRRERRAAQAGRAIERAAAAGVAADRLVRDPRGELRDQGIERALARSRAGDRPEGTPWQVLLREFRPEAPRPAADRAEAVRVRDSVVARLAALLGSLRGGGPPAAAAAAAASDPAALGGLVRDLCALAVRDPDLAIAIALGASPPPPPEDADRRLACHSFGVAVLALGAAIEQGYALEQLFEIGWAALFHDVGMVRLPASLAEKPAPLDGDERRELERHPLHAMEVLRRFAEVPLALAAVAIEEHERPDGSGYPRGLPGGGGELARIVAVADVFEALATARPHRPARPPHEAVREVVALGARRKLDSRALRSLLKSVTLFPIGSFLRLSDGARARVVRPGAADPARPRVVLLPAAPAPADGPAGARAPLVYVDLSERPDLKIAAADLPPPPGLADPLLGF